MAMDLIEALALTQNDHLECEQGLPHRYGSVQQLLEGVG